MIDEFLLITMIKRYFHYQYHHQRDGKMQKREMDEEREGKKHKLC